MSFEPVPLFPGILLDSASRWAHDAASHYPKRPDVATIQEMGWNAVMIPEALGGADGDMSDLGSLIEGLASHAVDLPIITRCGIIPTMLKALTDGDAQALAHSLLADIAEGKAVVELGGPLHAGDPQPPLIARVCPEGWRLSGATSDLMLTDDCTHVLLIAKNEADGTPLLFVVDSAPLRATAVAFVTMDDRPVVTCRLEDSIISADKLLASGEQAADAVLAGKHIAITATAADTVCTMGNTLAQTITYLLERQQFGQSLSQFQALRHDVARLYVTYELARNLLHASMKPMESTENDERTRTSQELLGLYTSGEAVKFAESVIQLHGGMGMTREMPAARQATRLLANAYRHGDELGHHHELNVFRTGVRQ